MTTPVHVLPPAALNAAGVPAVSKVPVNVRVTAAAGPITAQADVMQFPGPNTLGQWLVASTRAFAMGAPLVNLASVGVSYNPPPVVAPVGPMTVSFGDPRIFSM